MEYIKDFHNLVIKNWAKDVLGHSENVCEWQQVGGVPDTGEHRGNAN